MVTPFTVAVDPAVLDDLRDRIARTRWPGESTEPGWRQGTELASLRRLLDAWHDFDWPAYERRLNELPHFRARIDDLDIHFVHVRGEGPDRLPIVLTHGWPGSFLEYVDLIPLLRDRFDVVVPSLPGYGFSAAPARPGVYNAVVADAWQRLMTDELGYQRFFAHGSDIGAGVTTQLGLRHPDRLAGIHLSATAMPRPAEPWSDAERAYLEWMDRWSAEQGAYMHQHATKPQTLGYGLNDSPAGLAGWVVEKYRDWSDSDGDVEQAIGRERLLATLTVYWATQTITPSIRMYYEHRRNATPVPEGQPIDVPAGFTLFPNEFERVPNPPRELAERFYRVEHWVELPRGGHFPGIEQPETLARHLRDFFTRTAPHRR